MLSLYSNISKLFEIAASDETTRQAASQTSHGNTNMELRCNEIDAAIQLVQLSKSGSTLTLIAPVINSSDEIKVTQLTTRLNVSTAYMPEISQ